MENILRLYAKPHNKSEPVICLDEKPVQLLDDLRPASLAKPGQTARRDYEYKRCGTANVFCAVEPKAGKYLIKVTERRKAGDFAEALRDIARRYHSVKTIHLVLDNLNTHCLKSIIQRFGQARGQALWRKFKFHFTPKHASWLNQAEIAISIFSRAVLRRRRHPDITSLADAAREFQTSCNAQHHPFQWKFTVRNAREKFKYNST
jgi:transposase